jgi:hypothetical protein
VKLVGSDNDSIRAAVRRRLPLLHDLFLLQQRLWRSPLSPGHGPSHSASPPTGTGRACDFCWSRICGPISPPTSPSGRLWSSGRGGEPTNLQLLPPPSPVAAAPRRRFSPSTLSRCCFGLAEAVHAELLAGEEGARDPTAGPGRRRLLKTTSTDWGLSSARRGGERDTGVTWPSDAKAVSRYTWDVFFGIVYSSPTQF